MEGRADISLILGRLGLFNGKPVLKCLVSCSNSNSPSSILHIYENKGADHSPAKELNISIEARNTVYRKCFLSILIGMVILISNLFDASLASLGNSRWQPKSKMAAKTRQIG